MDSREWLLASALILACSPLQAADITITVNGKVVAKPCTVSTTNATVDLGDLYTFSRSRQAPLRPGTGCRSI